MNRKLPCYLTLVFIALMSAVLPLGANGQNAAKEISGIVTDEAGVPLPQVTVVVEGTNVSSLTAGNGRYKIAAAQGKTLVFNLAGMNPLKIRVGAQSTINATMTPNVVGLEDVVVVGYGAQNKRDITTAISSINPDKLQDMPLIDISQVLMGQAAGVNVTSATGSPGGGFDIQIRGMSTLGADNNPLYVIDGVVLQVGTDYESDPLSFINPSDIESIEILKDAAAAAIYGSRASNGVVLITTKAGSIGKPTVSVTAKVGVQQLYNKVDMLSPQEFAQLAIEARDNLHVDRGGDINDPDSKRLGNMKTDYFREFLESGRKGTDWQDAIYRLAPYQEYQVSVSGGNQGVKYMISGGVMDQPGIVKNTNFTRFSLRSNIEANLGKRVTVGVKISPTYTVQDFIRTVGRFHNSNAGVIQGALLMNPIMDIYDPESPSGYTQGIGQGNAMASIENPVAKIDLIKDERTNFRFLGDAFINIKIATGLDFKVSGSANVNTFQRHSITPRWIGGYSEKPPRMNAIESNSNKTMTLQGGAQLSYKKTICKSHNLAAVAVYEAQFQRFDGVTAQANGTWTDEMMIVDGSLDESFRRGYSNHSDWGLVSGIGRLNYDYQNRFYLMGSIRADGTSKFAKQWGVFPAASAAWRVSKESFMKSASWITDLKLRGSYGVTGNNSIGNYRHLALIAGSNYALGGGDETVVSGVRVSSYGNDDLTWEKTYQVDGGIDIALFRNRLNLTVDYYDKQTHDLLLSMQMPYATGFNSRLTNIGRIQNRGWEFTLETRNLVRKFKWDTNFNISFNKQKVLELGPEGDPLYGTAQQFSNCNITQVGQPVGLFYGMKVVGVYQNQEQVDKYPGIKTGAMRSRPGEFIYLDANNDGTISLLDRTVIGDPHPDFTFGMTNSFIYKNFTLRVFLRGAVNFDVMNMAFAGTEYYMNANGHKSALNRWQSEQNPGDGKTPRVVRVDRAILSSEQLNSSFIEDGTFLNIQNVSLSYRFTPRQLKKLKLQGLTFTATVNNLYMFTNYRGYNPEGAMNIGSTLTPGVDWGTYPLARNYMFSVSTTF